MPTTTSPSRTADRSDRRPWRLRPVDASRRDALERGARLHRVLATLLAQRGHDDPDAIDAFLTCRPDGLHEPRLMPGMDAACARLARAIADGESILVHGDYDVDGVCGTALLVRLLRLVGARVAWHIPNRLVDGYSFGDHSVERARREEASICISVDNGTSAFETIAALEDIGVETIVTDHHEPPLPHPEFGALPPACAIVNPKLGEPAYPWPELCGTAVAFKLAWGLLQHLDGGDRVRPEYKAFLESQMALVALATVCDVVPLVDENRLLVHWGLKALRHKPTSGLAALCASAKLDGRTPTAEEVAFQIGPRINASGRLGAADRAVELLLTDRGDEARRLAAELEQLNGQRRAIEREVAALALEQAERFADPTEHPVLVVAGDGWHQGVVGIVASRLVERYGRPALVVGFSEEDGVVTGRGSGRSVEGFDLLGAMHAAKDLFARYGGHEQAAGCEIDPQNLDAAREAICAAARATLGTRDLELGPLEIDLEVPLPDMDATLMRQLDRLEPFGAANRKPVLLSHDVRLAEEPRRLGADGAHLSFCVRRGDHVLRAMAFGKGERASELVPGTPIHLVYSPRWNTFRGNTTLELEAIDFRCGGERARLEPL